MMKDQMALELPVRPALGRDDFMVTQSNALALAMVDMGPDWPDKRLLIHGPQGAGKSHIAAVWAAQSGAIVRTSSDLNLEHVPNWLAHKALVLEDIHQITTPIAQEACFHLLNMARAEGASLLMTARVTPLQLPLTLPDLASRLQACASVEIMPPDDALLSALLVKLFADVQVRVSPTVVAYLVPRIERSFAKAQHVVAELDRLALERKVPITRPLAAEVLA